MAGYRDVMFENIPKKYLYLNASAITALVVGIGYIILTITFPELPYYSKLKKTRNALTWNGNKAVNTIAKIINANPKDIKFHTCSYCVEIPSTNKEIMHVQFMKSEGDTIWHFAYNSKTKILVPASKMTFTKFNKLVDPKDTFIKFGGTWGGGPNADPRGLPSSWERLIVIKART